MKKILTVFRFSSFPRFTVFVSICVGFSVFRKKSYGFSVSGVSAVHGFCLSMAVYVPVSQFLSFRGENFRGFGQNP